MSTIRALLIMLGASFVMLAVALALSTAGGQESLAMVGIIYVDADATGLGNGTSWEDAYTTLQPALDGAVAGDQIWVAVGIYTPTYEFSPGDPRSATFQMKNGVALYGGFDPTMGGIAFDDRDWQANPTILSGDLNGDDGPGFANNDENSYHVFYHLYPVELNSTAVLDGFTISGGNSGFYVGAGMFNGNSSSPTLTNCTFSGNRSDLHGGGMYNIDPLSMTLSNCTFSGNSAGSTGGGMVNQGGSLMLTNCTFSGNTARAGGAIFNLSGSSPMLTNSILWADTPDEIRNRDPEDSPAVTYSDVQGGYEGMCNIDADPLFVDPANGDFHLGPGSPCIDVGDDEALDLPDYDFEGDARILDGDGDGTAIVDMGVDEVYGYAVYLPLVFRSY